MDSRTFIEAMLAAKDSAMFVEVCRKRVSASPHVSIDLGASQPLVEIVRRHEPHGWDWFLGDPDEDMRRVVVDYLIGSALNGGYFAKWPDGSVVQWTDARGSGSGALVEWMADVRRRGLLPGLDLTTPQTVEEALGADLVTQPHPLKRMEICKEIADQGRLDALMSLIAGTRTTLSDGTVGHRFTFSDVLGLVDLYPEGFGEDPLRKKAILFFILLSGHFASRGLRVENDNPLASDYQIPRGCEYAGVVSVSAALAAQLRSDTLLDVWSDEMMDYRAAAVVAARHVGGIAGREDWLVDGALFGHWRKDHGFKANSLPPARCDAMWF